MAALLDHNILLCLLLAGRGEVSIQSLSLPQVEESDVFQRDGFDIHSNAKISFTQAILGGEVRIPGLNGHIMVKARNS